MSSAPMADAVSPPQMTFVRPTSSTSLPRGMENANMPSTWIVTAHEMAVSECPDDLSTKGMAAIDIDITPCAGA